MTKNLPRMSLRLALKCPKKLSGRSNFVIPAKAGIQQVFDSAMDPRFRGETKEVAGKTIKQDAMEGHMVALALLETIRGPNREIIHDLRF